MTTGSVQAHERLLDDLVDEICAKLQNGEPIDNASLASKHPEVAEHLERLFATLVAMSARPRPTQSTIVNQVIQMIGLVRP